MNNTLWTNDNLFVLNGMNSESVDLIYLDPPFNSKRLYAAPVGSMAAGASFDDMWTWEDVDSQLLERMVEDYPHLTKYISCIGKIHNQAMMAYVTYMSQRLIELQRILKPTGSIYLHCDPTASHYLKIAMDRIFGRTNCINEIIWQRASGRAKGNQHNPRKLGTDSDSIFHYAKSRQYTYHGTYKPIPDVEVKIKFPKVDINGRRYHTQVPLFRAPSMKPRPNLCYEYKGISNPHSSGWRVNEAKLAALDEKGYIIWRDGQNPLRKTYADEYKGQPIGSLWTDIPNVTTGEEATGYPTQKPLNLMYRMIEASSNEGDLVLDPFCGCATTCVAAEHLGRNWIGIDIEKKARDLVVDRLSDAAGALFSDFIHRTGAPHRTDVVLEPPSQSIKGRLFKEQEKQCNGCGSQFDMHNLEIDHIIPKSKGGGNYKANYQLLCGNCNRVKGDRPMEYLRAKIARREATIESVSFGE